MTDNTADQHDPDQGGIVPPHILDQLGSGPPFSVRRDPFYKRDHLAAWLVRRGWVDEDATKLAEELISAGWITGVAPKETS